MGNCHRFTGQLERPWVPLLRVALLMGLLQATQVQANDELRKAVLETMKAATFPALITVDEQGQPRARTVDAFAPDENLVVWIATRPVTRKVEQIRQHPQVTLYYWHEATSSYVTLMGQATLVDDEGIKRAMRRPQDSERFYPDFPDDYLLIRVDPEYVEAIVPGYRGDKVTWRPARMSVKP